MMKFSHVIGAEEGLHARPAGLLVKECKRFSSAVSVEKDGRSADGKKLFSLLGLDVQQGEEVMFTVSGEDEQEALQALQNFAVHNL
ncbi:MAG TPA: HPr family phosphocarrier protein [Candidatus Caccousia avistercoris]|nr:HPr family phosphocarrier protein [Candidatus Caccousia avistercoris]